MNIPIDDAISRLPVQPGKPYRTFVNGQRIEIRVAPLDSESEETPVEEFWLPAPPGEKSITLTLQRCEPELPAPIHISEADLAPE